ncbi:formylglycine-generating enzyme family protein [Candidatus Halobeggiatoa sp. HSG11]|nr:formylglycine-generating enzyme family protein [Candidatus Halobeggiatoa sp. HSG11]
MFPSNAFGLYDMHGNVWEWCTDGWHNNYKNAPTDGSVWKKDNEDRVLRGGSWYSYPVDIRSACRCDDSKFLFYGDSNIGFRVVRT